MSDARDTVLARIRSALATPAGPYGQADAPPAFRRRSEATLEDQIAEFAERARGYKVRVERCGRPEARTLAAHILAERGHVRLAVPADLPPDLTPEGLDFVVDSPDLGNEAIASCEGVLTTCACAIAQTGTLVLDHGTGQGRRKLTLLPDYHLCFVPVGVIVGLVPEAVERMAPSVKAGRPLTFISGPSATSDIELNRVEGVHGPRTLDVLLLDE